MSRKIAVAFNEAPEARWALVCAIEQAKKPGAALSSIPVAAELLACTAFAGAVDPSLCHVLAGDREKFYKVLVH